MFYKGALALSIWLVIAGAQFAAEAQEAVVRRVLGGDTLMVTCEERTERVRLIGITCQSATPEGLVERFNPDRQVRGDKAKTYVESLLKPGDTVRLEFDVKRYDRTGSLLGYLFLADGSLLNEKLVLEGLARPLAMAPNTRYDKKIKKAFEKVQKSKGSTPSIP